MSTLDGLTGALGVLIVGGVLLKTTDALFGKQKKAVRLQTRKGKRANYPGDFRNIGF